MAKKIDGFLLYTAAAAALYLYFQSAFGSWLLSLVLALLGMAVLRRTIRLLVKLFSGLTWMKRRRMRKQAGAVVLKFASMEEKEAERALGALLKKCYAGEYEFALVQAHPSTRLSEGQVFSIWKRMQGREKLVICASCRADAACRAMAASLKGPRVALVDSDAICQMIAEHPEDYPLENSAAVRTRLKFSHIAMLLFNRKNAPRNLVLALSMAVLYVFSGNVWYLISAIGLVFVSLVSLHRTVRPAKLF